MTGRNQSESPVAIIRCAHWSSYLVGLRSITVPRFTMDETRRLLTVPLAESRLWRARGEVAPHFDPRFWSDGGIERIHTEAAGWPHLVQLLAETAVELANNRQMVALDAGVLEEAIDEAVERGTVVLSELIERESKRRLNGSIYSASARTRRRPPSARMNGAQRRSPQGASTTSPIREE